MTERYPCQYIIALPERTVNWTWHRMLDRTWAMIFIQDGYYISLIDLSSELIHRRN